MFDVIRFVDSIKQVGFDGRLGSLSKNKVVHYLFIQPRLRGIEIFFFSSKNSQPLSITCSKRAICSSMFSVWKVQLQNPWNKKRTCCDPSPETCGEMDRKNCLLHGIFMMSLPSPSWNWWWHVTQKIKSESSCKSLDPLSRSQKKSSGIPSVRLTVRTWK